MKLVKVGAAAINTTPLAWDANAGNIVGAIEEARAEGVSILCLPELCISGYGCEDAFYSPGLHETALEVLREILPETRGMVVSLGLPIFFENGTYNAACLAVDGEAVGLVAKRFLPSDGIHYEPRWFRGWPAGERDELTLGDKVIPIGDLSFNVGGVRIGFEICEDAWVAHRTGSDLALRGADIILNPSASHFAFGKQEVRKRIVSEGSRSFGVAYVYTNLLGNEAGRIIYDGGALIADSGSLHAFGPRFSFAERTLTTAVVDISADRMVRAKSSSYGSAPRELEIRADFSYPELRPAPPPEPPTGWEQGPHPKEEEFTRAVGLALFDYLRKSRSRGFVISLSGGADSSGAACLVALMVELAVAELGIDEFRRRLGHIDLAGADTPRALVGRLLLCVYQATENSSELTREAARRVAEGIGAEFLVLDVNGLVKDYVSMVEGAFGRRLTWEKDDLALQNIQARARGPGVWMLANLRGALLLATSNRSEAAVGYATMDGDTCGGLSPIAGIDKAFLRRWLRWLEREGPQGGRPIPELSAVNAQQPTAELRPAEAAQTDESDLMPYDLLDAIEGAAIRDKHTPREAYLEMRALFPDIEPRQLFAWVERFFVLWCRNQWKRERYAPSFHLDDKNLDPKTWCRFPILSGGYRRELEELREYVEREE